MIGVLIFRGVNLFAKHSNTVVCKKVDQAEKQKLRNRPAPPNSNFYVAQCNTFILNHKPKMPTRLLDDVIYRIQLCLECAESPVEIYKATKASISMIQCMHLNLNLFSQPYTPSTVVLRRPKALLPT
jgi:hypothetical protein